MGISLLLDGPASRRRRPAGGSGHVRDVEADPLITLIRIHLQGAPARNMSEDWRFPVDV